MSSARIHSAETKVRVSPVPFAYNHVSHTYCHLPNRHIHRVCTVVLKMASPSQSQEQSTVVSESLMQRALTLISSKEACKAGLGCDPGLLLLLILDPVSVLDVQVPVGRHLLHALNSMNIR